MKNTEQRNAAILFTNNWIYRGDEKSDTQTFWLTLLQKVFNIKNPEDFIQFEKRVKIDNMGFIDAYIPKTKVLIEQKSADVDIRNRKTPLQQAQKYNSWLPHDEHARWIVICNFQEFHIYDMNYPHDKPEIVKLSDLGRDYHRLKFLVETEDDHIQHELEVSIKAGEIVGMLYDAFLKQYTNPESDETLKSLNILCVRLVFCLFAEDSDVFEHGAFHDYMAEFKTRDMRKALVELFQVLDTKIEDRDQYLATDNPRLAAFPYVDGGLFAYEGTDIPPLTDEIRTLLLEKSSRNFDWSEISPTIFGAVFESTLNPETRRKGGMHYTSIENIHKVIDPLFMDDLRREFSEICRIAGGKERSKKLVAFQEKLGSLTFLDPACGSGNFLTETYLSLRRLENEIIRLLYRNAGIGQNFLNVYEPIHVQIRQFYGIEINDFAVVVAKTALWIAEGQTLRETEDIVERDLNFLPLTTNATIVEGNALRMDWETFEGADILDVFSFMGDNESQNANDTQSIPPHTYDYIIGNPPFVGHQLRDARQASDMKEAFYDLDKHGKLDYVAAWYNKACDLIKATNTKCAFVSTNSICQGESVGILWRFLFRKGLNIIFAYQPFVWDSESTDKAHVHCVVIGFVHGETGVKKRIYHNDTVSEVSHINGYLIDAPDVYIEARGKSLTKGMPEMTKGSQPTDGGNLILSEKERYALVAKYPSTQKFIRQYVGAEEFINNKKRYCLWLEGVAPSEYRGIKPIMERLKSVAKIRSNSPTVSVKCDAEAPALFTQIRQPKTNYLVVPQVSSERRKYMPIGFMNSDVIATNAVQIIPNASLYIFGVLTSLVHMAWMRVVCGRLKSDYRYIPAVYNNFPWPRSSKASSLKIEATAQGILDARALYPDNSLADLYDPLTMPVELQKAHQANDKAVMKAYGFRANMSEAEIVAELMKMYQKLV